MTVNVYEDYSAFYDKKHPKKYFSTYQFLNEEWDLIPEKSANEILKTFKTKDQWITSTTKALEKQTAASKIGIAIFGRKVVQILQ